MTPPVLDYDVAGVRHRLWVFPPLTYVDGGVSSERHYYVVGDDPFAVSFTVHAGRYPENRGNVPPSGMDAGGHRAWEQETGHGGCYALSGRRCSGDGSEIDAWKWYADEPKDADGFVPGERVFALLRGHYALRTETSQQEKP